MLGWDDNVGVGFDNVGWGDDVGSAKGGDQNRQQQGLRFVAWQKSAVRFANAHLNDDKTVVKMGHPALWRHWACIRGRGGLRLFRRLRLSGRLGCFVR
jgi:hypothetical protein